MDDAARDIVHFWTEEVGPKGWYAVDDDLDARVRERYLDVWQAARAGALDGWRGRPPSCLALLIVLDQFPRNMFRGRAEAFSSDPRALAVAKRAVALGLDDEIEPPARQFFYLPMMHAETVADQERSVRLVLLKLGRGETLRHARAHREIIRRFGRFPYRNAALGRSSTPAEEAFLAAGGYGPVVAAIPA